MKISTSLMLSVHPCEDYGYIRSILRSAWSFYRSSVHIERKAYQAGPMEDGRFILQRNGNGADWLVTDRENLITIFFEDHKFNDTQKIVNHNDFTQEQIAALPRIMREIGDWMGKNHYDKIF